VTLRRFLKYTAIGRVIMIPVRFCQIALPRLFRQFGMMVKWAFTSKEHYNHTYHLTQLNKQYLASYIAVVSGHDVAEIERYIAELEGDALLRDMLVRRTLESPARHNSDAEPRYGRRLGWYALLRATKPKVVVETGIDRGLGTVVMAAALKRNSEENCPGLIYATDIVPDCGHLIGDEYRPFCRELIGDSVEHLKKFAEPVDIFLHDSDHRPEYEWAEFVAIEPRLHERSIVLSDNSQETSKLREFAARIDRSFLYFQDTPRDHWWPGDGIGATFEPGVRYQFQITRA
jgi:predicted O-methyltransferase YrrM